MAILAADIVKICWLKVQMQTGFLCEWKNCKTEILQMWKNKMQQENIIFSSPAYYHMCGIETAYARALNWITMQCLKSECYSAKAGLPHWL